MTLAAGLGVALLAILSTGCGEPAVPGRIEIRAGEIEVQATIHNKRFHSSLSMPGYHAVVWRGGRAAGAALLRTEATDLEVLQALESLGANPGNNLSMKTWDERKDPKSREPDRAIAGPQTEVFLRLPRRKEPVPLAEILEDPGRRGLDLRLGGNRANAPAWRSGCVVCLYSCPGSKIGNARYTVRDYVGRATRFRVRPGALPPDGTRVGVIFRLGAEGAGR